MKRQFRFSALWLAPAVLLLSQQAPAEIPGVGRVAGDTTSCVAAGCTFNLTARAGHITLGDANQLLAWGYGLNSSDHMQYPGPTLIVNEGDVVRISLQNTLPVPVSIVFPGQEGVVASGSPGLLTSEATPGGSAATYRFVATHAGTYLYQSGTQPELQIEMGLVGTLIVRPAGFDPETGRTAYGTAASAYDREYLFFQTDMDRCAHEAVEQVIMNGVAPSPATHNPPDVCSVVDPASYKATLWFLNGRNGPDTMLQAGVDWLPMQPYNSLPRMHPGERILMRLVGAGRDLHPFHHHGNNAWVIARDGRVLESAPGVSAGYPDFEGIPDLAAATLPDQAVSNFTIQTAPGNTYDAIFTWTGKGLNWDIYGPCDAGKPGHNAGTRMPHEPPDIHCKAFPVDLPEQQALTFGGFWSGSQYLEELQALPPLQGGLNPGGGYTFMWHSHTERELTNDDIFPGGMMTMMIIEGPNVGIDEHDFIAE